MRTRDRRHHPATMEDPLGADARLEDPPGEPPVETAAAKARRRSASGRRAPLLQRRRGARRSMTAVGIALAAIALAAGVHPPVARAQGAIVALPNETSADGCLDNFLLANDDGSTGVIGLPFTLNFFGATYGALWVNNNGNVTFDGALSTYTPFDLLATTHVIVAPFFADIDTRGPGSGITTWGATSWSGRPAFCVDWVNVGYYGSHTDKLNSIQLVLVDRSDIQVGDFDMIFNYDRIQWETGDASEGQGGLGGSSARVGYSNGVSTSLELPGSAVNGAFLDDDPTTGLVNSSRDSLQLGRYVFPVRNGVAPVGGRIAGGVFANSIVPANALAGSLVEICGTDDTCRVTTTAANGQYSVSGLPADTYRVTAFPPPATEYVKGIHLGVVLLENQVITDEDVILVGPTPPPNNVGITSMYTNLAGLPVIYWNSATTLTATGCSGGAGSYEVHGQDGSLIAGGGMTEAPAGTYETVVPPFTPNAGHAQVSIVIACPDTSHETMNFDIYIDPSGTVTDTNGNPIEGATVTLYRSDSSVGPFEIVPDGSAVMSPVNRDNPDLTVAGGHFGWDVIAGWYKVRAEKAGCVAPADDGATFVETGVLAVPPPVTDLALVLDCGEHNTCGNGSLDPGEECDGSEGGMDASCCTDSCRFVSSDTSCSDDGNVCTNDVCNGAGTCAHVANDSDCEDGDACTTGDHCVDTACVGGGPVECPSCLECDSTQGCVARPDPDCHVAAPGTSTLWLSTRENGRLTWRMSTQPGEGDRAEFGDPISSTDYTLCLYDAVDTTPRLVLKAPAPHDGHCGGDRPCWVTAQNQGLHFGNLDPNYSAVRMIELRSHVDGSAHLGVRGRGESLDLVHMPLDPKVTLQLQSSDGACWSASYGSPRKSTADRFEAKSD